MKFRCDRDDLSEALQTVQRGVSTRPGIPALTGVLLDAGSDTLTLTTTDLETRIAILQLKARRDQIEVPDDVLDLIASKFDQNIRELEGALLRVAAYSSLMREPITLSISERALEDLLPQPGSEIPAQVILDETAKYFGLTREDLISKNRSRPLTTARHVAMYMMRECTGLSLIKIGELFDRDHTTVLHGVKKVEALMRDRAPIYRQVHDLTKKVRSMGPGA